jgi:hypothetical protein
MLACIHHVGPTAAAIAAQELPQLPFLESMSIRGCTTLGQGALAGLSGLTRLAVDSQASVVAAALLSGCPTLRALTLAGPLRGTSYEPAAVVFGEQDVLPLLVLDGCDSVPDTGAFGSKVKALTCSRCSFTELSGASLEALSNLTHLGAVECPALTVVQLCSSVQQLVLQDCGVLANVQGLRQGDEPAPMALIEFEVHRCSTLALPCLRHLTNLQRWQVGEHSGTCEAARHKCPAKKMCKSEHGRKSKLWLPSCFVP